LPTRFTGSHLPTFRPCARKGEGLHAIRDAGTICTTEEVLIEYLNFFAGWGPHFRRKVSINIRNMQESRTVQIVPQTSTSFLAGLGLYGSRLDKGYSLTDCISMQTMREGGITDVLTNDMHFEQEGFRALFRDT
jgi:predicted nucleic acid-binding protein